MSTQEKPRLSRLTAILTQLQSKQILTAREIAQKHQVSIRTVYRDIRTLENSGIPIITEEGKGYSLMEGFTLPPVMFTQNEANALITAEQLILKNKDNSFVEDYKSAITKMKAVLRNNQKEKTELLSERIIIRGTHTNQTTSTNLMTIQSAITNFNLMHIEYHSIPGNITQREIEPFALYSTQENWILIAFCRLRKDFRAFRLDHIKTISTLHQTFTPHPFTLQEYFNECAKKYKYPPDTPLS
ncbi:YafY family protein [Aquimarina sp. RZ0]|uniref:helix-turn-helix transcriptional regulator n=1 Tax=Aquimarina sp. RZ0 TaxID=2607730 RepID=UPI0011F24478|nr:YafY family protein [Aquimarina sp. RZ0]KAA1247950.1 YafY family transcriptional regulator [Aquimarina sp. RZ0]